MLKDKLQELDMNGTEESQTNDRRNIHKTDKSCTEDCQMKDSNWTPKEAQDKIRRLEHYGITTT